MRHRLLPTNGAAVAAQFTSFVIDLLTAMLAACVQPAAADCANNSPSRPPFKADAGRQRQPFVNG